MTPNLLALGILAGVLAQPAPEAGPSLPQGAIVGLGSVRFLHGDWVHTIAFSPDGKLVLGATHEPFVRMWDIGGNELGRLTGEGSLISEAALSPNGDMVAATDNGGNFRVWKVANGKVLFKIPIKGSLVRWSPDGKTLAASGGAGGDILLIDSANGKETARLIGHKNFVHALAFAENQPVLVSASREDRTVRVWDLEQKKVLRQFEGLVDGAFAISPDGKFAAGACSIPIDPKSYYTKVRVWNLENGKIVHELPVYVNSLIFSRDSKFLVTGDFRGLIRFLDLVTGKETRQWLAHQNRVTALAFSKNGTTLASGGTDLRIRLWDSATGKEVWPHEGHSGAVLTVAFSPDGRTLVSGGLDQSIRFWDWQKGRELGRVGGGGEYWLGVEGLAFTATGKTLVSIDKNYQAGQFRMWDPVTHKQKARFGDKTLPVVRFVLMPDQETLAGACQDGTIGIWELTSGKLLRKIGKHKDRLVGLAVSPDGNTIAWAGGFQGMGFWDSATGKDILRLKGSHHGMDSELAFSLDGTLLATASSHDPVRLWEVASGKVVVEFPQLRHAHALAFSPQGLVLAAAYVKEIVLWDVASRKEIARFQGRSGEMKGIAWHPNGGTLASAATDGTVLVWDVTGLRKDARPTVVRLQEKHLEELWQQLADKEPGPAYQALWQLAACPTTPTFLAKRLRPIDKKDDVKDPKVADERGRSLRALLALENCANPQAKKLLQTLAEGLPEALLTRQARSALERLDRQGNFVP